MTEMNSEESRPWTLTHGDSLELLDDADALPDESAHAIVTDPPYGINFMPDVTNGWDDFDPHEYQSWCKEWAEKALRVVKPGGHLLAFSGERTYHRLMCGVEDAGWTVRTSIMWLHGQGFPKGSDVSKHIDRYYDAEDEREVVGKKVYGDGHVQNSNELGRPIGTFEMTGGDGRIETTPATSEAEKWEGWKSQLKPAFEPIVVARKPLSESAIYRNVLEHGTGAYNIDACRVPIDGQKGNWPGKDDEIDDEANYGDGRTGGEAEHANGRYPANVVIDEHAAGLLDEQSGDVGGHSSGKITGDVSFGTSENVESDGPSPVYSDTPGGGSYTRDVYADNGGASRFYYTSKAPKSERTHDGEIENDHPTVKPLDLMQWLVRLVTADGQTVIDPFTGSGTTGIACLKEGRRFHGIERDEEYHDLATKRLTHTQSEQAQQNLAEYAEADDD